MGINENRGTEMIGGEEFAKLKFPNSDDKGFKIPANEKEFERAVNISKKTDEQPHHKA